MGMFSWECKGCGEEICEPEVALVVVSNGITWGPYDGYGCCGMFEHDFEDPAMWHKYCYDHATAEEKADTSPSKYAPNQGFGAPNEKFK